MTNLSACPLCGSSDSRNVNPETGIAECVSCGLVFHYIRPEPAEISEYYSRETKYDLWLGQEKARDRLWKKRLKKMQKHAMPGTLLDIGAGIGQFLHHAKPHFTKVAGTEISTSAVRISKEKYGIELVRGLLEEIDFGGERFDNITVFHVIEHVQSPGALIEKCRGLLNPGGILFIAAPNDLNGLKNKVKAAAGKIFPKRFSTSTFAPINLECMEGEIHLSHFSPRVLSDYLTKSGFKVLDASLDAYSVSIGIKGILNNLFYYLCLTFNAVTGMNVYDTFWIAAQKTD
jgi:2-polyprenyl-3-methyl-5-hydroxy-6-metoxy-1,4-benzoquinol methylase